MVRKPTPQQIEAYRFVFINDCTHREAAMLMGCTRSNVSHLIKKLKKSNPHLFLKNGKIKTIRYHNGLDTYIVDKF